MAKPKTVSFSKTWDFENKYFVKFKSETDRQAKRIANNLRNNDKVKKVTALAPTFQQYREAFVKQCFEVIGRASIELAQEDRYDTSIQRASGLGYQVALLAQFTTNTAQNIYFENEELESFLRDTRIKQIAGLKEYIKKNGLKVADIPLVHELVKDETVRDTLYQVYNIHIPNQNFGYVFTFIYFPGYDVLYVGFIHQLDKYNKSSYAYALHTDDDLKRLSSFFEKEKDSLEKTQLSTITFAINFLYYILCFPEMLVNGLTINIKDANKLDHNNMYLYVSPKIVDSSKQGTSGNKRSGTSVCTHFRQGHFRFCGSDYFKEKKGQVVFVHAAIVNGNNVKTCLDKEQQ